MEACYAAGFGAADQEKRTGFSGYVLDCWLFHYCGRLIREKHEAAHLRAEAAIVKSKAVVVGIEQCSTLLADDSKNRKMTGLLLDGVARDDIQRGDLIVIRNTPENP